jgi:hypothetical protein
VKDYIGIVSCVAHLSNVKLPLVSVTGRESIELHVAEDSNVVRDVVGLGPGLREWIVFLQRKR